MFRIAGKGWGALATSRKAVESAIRRIEAYLSRNVSVFISYAVVDALIFCHSPLSSPQHHLQPLLPQVLSGLLQVLHRQDPAGFECTYSLDFKF